MNSDWEEENLDPVDWEKFSDLGHRMVDDMVSYLKDIKESKIWQPIPDTVKEHYNQKLPSQGTDLQEIYDEFNHIIKPYNMGGIHPRFWGWVTGTGTPGGVLAEFLAAMLNANLLGGEHAANYIETQVIEWAKQMMGYGENASGILVSGGSMANFTGLAVARNVLVPAVMENGVREDLTVYGSVEMHSSIDKSVQLLGLGYDNLRKIEVDDSFKIRLDLLRTRIDEDIVAGKRPLCIVGNAGTVNTAAVDDLVGLSQLAKEYNMWFHVDGAFGALCALSADLKSLVDGIELADSLGFDFHKWMYIPYEAAITLVRNQGEHYRSFSVTPEYLRRQSRGAGGGERWHTDYGLQLSRNFKALKIWMSIKEHGMDKYGRMMLQNVNQAKYLEHLISEHENLELLAPVEMIIVNFRYVPGEGYHLNGLNEEILLQLHERGIAVPSSTTLNGNFSIRVAISNQRSRRVDFDILVGAVLEIGKELESHYQIS